MHKLGLKLWSTNRNYLKPAQELFAQGVYDYIELYSVPGSFDEYNKAWKELQKAGIPFLIHAPHFDGGLNFALKEKFEANMALAKQAQDWADILEAKYIIFHPGIGGDIKETARQINVINDPRILIENKPYNIRLGPEYICNGHNPEEIGHVLQNTSAGFCLDIGHAICAANSVKTDKWQRLREFLALKPSLIHISDGDNDGILDSHQHLGAGSYDLERIFGLLPEDIPVSIETEKNSQENLDDFKADVNFMRKLQMKLKITIATNKNSWFLVFAEQLKNALEAEGADIALVFSAKDVKKGDIAFYLSFEELVPSDILKLNTHNIVVHASALPQGKGWSPLSWQILEGKNTIPLTLFEAADKVDSGAVYMRSKIEYRGTELLEELQNIMGAEIVKMSLMFVSQFPDIINTKQEQTGTESFYKKRTPADSVLDPDKTIKEQFNLLRIVDNRKYPAFFYIDGIKYILKIEKEKK